MHQCPVPEIAGILPEVSWLFFKAVRAGLAVKHPYLSHTGRASNAEKQTTGLGPEGCDENGPAGGTYRRVGVCKASSTSSGPPGRYCRVEKQSYSPDADTPIRRPAGSPWGNPFLKLLLLPQPKPTKPKPRQF